jgi:hypothetical protein
VVAQLTIILERHERRFGQIDDEPEVEVRDWYAIYINEGPAAMPCWRLKGDTWMPWQWP